MSDDLTLKVDGQELTGWTGVSVTRSIAQIPNTFSVQATASNPMFRAALGVRDGDACTVSIGGDLVITGYVDTVHAGYRAGDHTVIIQGRGKCQDLVDCSAEWPGCQISGADALEIAQKLAAPYGITVTAPDGAGPAVPQFNISIGEKPTDILELVTRHAGLLYYEDANGNLVLAEAAADDAGSGFVEGQNIQVASILRTRAQRFSEYTCSLLSLDTSGLFEDKDGLFYFTAKDPNVGRNRKLFIVAEGVQGGLELAEKRALWEASRRAGRGEQVNITTDSWRDGTGKLWTPNSLAPVSSPALNLTDALLCIAEVTYRRALETGTTAEVLLMPRESFLPEPIQIQPLVGGVV
jgi:prophage tail gpP-like protein